MMMVRDSRDEWPDDVPRGTFDIEPGTVQDHPGATAHITFVCPNGQRCSLLVGPQHVDRLTPDSLPVWGWDGNFEHPTLTPSINCVAEKNGQPTSGCGWHGYITAGVMR